MRLAIVGLDGLDPDLVERWRMDWFKQRAWGRHYVGFISVPHTPVAWSCFLTGLNVEEHGYSFSESIEKRTREGFRSSFLYKLYLLRKRIPIKKLGLRKLLIKLGLIDPYSPSIMPQHLLENTFLRELEVEGYRVVAIEVPGYSERVNEYYRSTVWNYVFAPFREKSRFVEELMEVTKERVLKASEYVEQGYDLVFTYTSLPDSAFHLVPRPTLKGAVWLRTTCYKLYNIVKPLLEVAYRNGYAILMVSDHGFNLKNYNHSDYGFWSLSIEPPSWWRVSSILDFKENILKLVKLWG